jgi:hypothetical protein
MRIKSRRRSIRAAICIHANSAAKILAQAKTLAKTFF